MSSKEEIEYMKKFFNECITKDLINSEDLAIRFMSVALKYIEQLEADKQKLIEKLEEKIKNNKAKTDCTFCNNTCNSYATCKVCQEILSIMKGEKEREFYT